MISHSQDASHSLTSYVVASRNGIDSLNLDLDPMMAVGGCVVARLLKQEVQREEC